MNMPDELPKIILLGDDDGRLCRNPGEPVRSTMSDISCESLEAPWKVPGEASIAVTGGMGEVIWFNDGENGVPGFRLEGGPSNCAAGVGGRSGFCSTSAVSRVPDETGLSPTSLRISS
jgi:hypothetical protein